MREVSKEEFLKYREGMKHVAFASPGYGFLDTREYYENGAYCAESRLNHVSGEWKFFVGMKENENDD